MAYVGSASVASSATVSNEVVVVLPCVPATATTRLPCISDSSAAERGSSRRPSRTASTTSGLSSRTAVDTTTLSASCTCEASCPTSTRAPRARSDASTGPSWASEPVTVMPRASISRAMPDRAAPPMPTKCTRPSCSAGNSSSGTGTLMATSRRPSAPSARAARRRRAAPGRRLRPTWRRGGRVSASSAGTLSWTHCDVRSLSSTSTPPPTATTGLALRACSPLPCGSGTNTAGSPTLATSVTVLAPARQMIRSAAA